MNRFAHHASSAAASLGQDDFELVQQRYLFAPAVMWALAMGVVIALTAVSAPPDRLAQPATEVDAAATWYGA